MTDFALRFDVQDNLDISNTIRDNVEAVIVGNY